MLTIKCDVKLFSWQIDVIKNLLKFPHDVHVVKSKRQVGKSTVATLIILKYALEKKNSKNFYMSPTYKLARKVYEDIANVIRDTAPVKKLNNTTMEIYFVNGSKISFLSAEQSIESLQGYTCTGILIVDESAYIDDDVYFAISPYVDVNKAPTLIISTPLFKSGFFYDLYTLGVNDEYGNVHSVDFSKYDTSALLTAEKLEFYRKSLPKIKFILQYLGEFADLDSDVFGDLTKVVKPGCSPNQEMEIVFGVDWSTGQNGDETAISIWDKKRKKNIALFHFGDKDATATIEYLFELIEIYHPTKIKVESNSIGAIFIQLIKRELNKRNSKTLLLVFNTSNASKEKIVNQMLVAILNEAIELLDDAELINQMAAFEARKTNNGAVQYGNGKDSAHDDLVMATLIGYDCCLTGSYTII